MRTTVPIGSKGRLVVPYPIREELDLDNGDLVEIEVRPVNEVSVDG